MLLGRELIVRGARLLAGHAGWRIMIIINEDSIGDLDAWRRPWDMYCSFPPSTICFRYRDNQLGVQRSRKNAKLDANTRTCTYGHPDVNDLGELPLPWLYLSTVRLLCSVVRVALSHAG